MKKEFYHLVCNHLTESKKTSAFFVEILRVESDDIVYFKVFDTKMNLKYTSFRFNAKATILEIFEFFNDNTGCFYLINKDTICMELSEEGFNFLKTR